MKTPRPHPSLILLVLFALLAVLWTPASAQTNAPTDTAGLPVVASTNPPASFWDIGKQLGQAVSDSGLGNATNYSVAPYLTYAPKAKDHYGAGVLCVYNVSSYLGAGFGVDYLGSFNLVSGNVTLKKDIYPFRTLGFAKGTWLETTTVTPFVLTGVGVPLGGTGGNGGAATVIYDLGGYTQFGHWLGGRFGAGACYGSWSGAGPDYSVKRYHLFLSWQKGF